MSLLRFFVLIILMNISLAFECGKQKVTRGLSVGGEYSEVGQWPWLASIYRKEKYICGSAIISKRHLMGAAHCVHPKGQQSQSPTADFHAYLGRHDLNNKNDPNSVRAEFSEIFIHKDWSSFGAKYDADISVYLTKSEIEFSNYIQPICLPSSDAEVFNIEGAVVGYGLSESSSRHENLPKHVEIKTVGHGTCFFAEPIFATVGSIRMFCAGSKGKNPCKGDSGSPFMIEKADQWTINGIVSTAPVRECHENDFVLFTKVSSFIDWIKETVDSSSNINVDHYPCGMFLPYDPVNAKDDPALFGFQGGVNYDNTIEYIGYGNGHKCGENPSAGFISIDTNQGAGAYIPCVREISFDKDNAHYLLKNSNLEWIPTNPDEMFSLDGVLKTFKGRFAWGRAIDEGQYRVGKVHWNIFQAGLYIQDASNKEQKFSTNFEVLSCRTDKKKKGPINPEDFPCGTFLKYDPVNAKDDPALYGFQGGVNFDDTTEYVGYGDNEVCFQSKTSCFISIETSAYSAKGAGAYSSCRTGVAFDNKNAYYLLKNEKLKWVQTDKSSMFSISNAVTIEGYLKFAFGRVFHQGQYRVGKLHYDERNGGLYVQDASNVELEFYSDYEILTCNVD